MGIGTKEAGMKRERICLRRKKEGDVMKAF